MSFLPLSVLYSVLIGLRLLGLMEITFEYIGNTETIVFGVIFLLLLVFNQVYFFSINNWREVIVFFRARELSGKPKLIAYIYLSLTGFIYIVLFLFLGY